VVTNDRLNLPFTGIMSFCKVPVHADLETLDADVAIIGAPFDLGTQYRSGTRFGPRAIRNASALYALRGAGYYDHELDTTFLNGFASWIAAMST
jgi:agmatinase